VAPTARLLDLSHALSTLATEIAEDHGLTLTQVRLLSALAPHPLRMTDLATLLGVRKTAITGLVDRAQHRGLLTRTPSPHDARAALISLTPQGRSLHHQTTHALNRRLNTLTAPELALLETLTQHATQLH
jgi:DNA-binding MarR family transcriptional regulator